MNVVQVSRKVLIIADRSFPVPLLPSAAFASVAMTGDSGSPVGRDFENAVLIARQRPGKSVSPSGEVHRQCMWFGRTTQPSM
jgi:hypothetical protein